METRAFASLGLYDAIKGNHGLAPSVARGIPTLTITPRDQNSRAGAAETLESPRRISMRKLMAILFAISLLACFSLAAQDTMKQDTPKTDASAKATSITGKISDDGKTFVSDSDGKSWTITNPDVVKGHEGHHVTLKAKVSADTNEVNVLSLKMAADSMK